MSDYLIHYKKGSVKEEHKYVSRESKNGKWKYTYTKVADTSDTVPSEIKEETTSESKYYIDDDGIKRDKENGNFIWNGERPEEVEKIIEKEGTMDFENDNDANHFRQLYRAYLHSKTKHSDIEGGSEEMDNNEKKYYYLAHGEKGSEWSNHLYTARKWVNGKWQYIYNNVSNAAKQTANKLNNALGADERERRDEAYSKYGAKALNAQKIENKSNNINRNNGYRGQESAIKLAAGTRNTADRYKKAYDKAQSDYDKTFYGTVDKAKKAASDAGTKIVKGASRAKDIVSEYGKKTLASLGEAKDKAVAKGRDILNNLLKKRKKG